MKINIIHLKSRDEDRSPLLKQELLNQNITDYQLWDGITGGTPRENISSAHKQIVRQAKEQGLREVCIAEDDFHFPAKDGYDYFLKQQPYDFDIYLSGIYKAIETRTPNSYVFNGLHFYIIHSRFYDTFLNLDTTKQDLDMALSSLARQLKAKVVICFPYACVQHETISDNSSCVFQHKYFFNEHNVYGWEK
jgi:hypothetical protein